MRTRALTLTPTLTLILTPTPTLTLTLTPTPTLTPTRQPDGSVVGPTGIVIGVLDGRGAIRAVETRSAPKPTRGYDGFSAGGAPPSEFGGMAGPGHALLASQPLYQVRYTSPTSPLYLP